MWKKETSRFSKTYLCYYSLSGLFSSGTKNPYPTSFVFFPDITSPKKKKPLSSLSFALFFFQVVFPPFFQPPCSFFSCNLLMLPASAQITIFCYLLSIIPLLSYSFAPLLQPPSWPQGGHIFATRLMHAASWKLSFTSNKISSIPLRGNIKYPLVLLIKAIIINTRVGLQKEGVYKYVPLWWSSQV